VRLLHDLAKIHATFDDPNLVSRAGPITSSNLVSHRARSTRWPAAHAPARRGMRVAVLGTGVVGRTLAAKLDELGHEVVIGTREPAVTNARTEPGGFGTPPFPHWQAGHPEVRLLSFAEAAAFAGLVLSPPPGRRPWRRWWPPVRRHWPGKCSSTCPTRWTSAAACCPRCAPGEHPTASVSRSSARSPPYAWSRR